MNREVVLLKPKNDYSVMYLGLPKDLNNSYGKKRLKLTTYIFYFSC